MIAFCGSYVNPLVLDAADGTCGGGESLMGQAVLMIASCGSYVNPGFPDAVSDFKASWYAGRYGCSLSELNRLFTLSGQQK